MNDDVGNTDVPSTHEVANFLREEGFYDPSLSAQEMYDLYQALSNSKNTASAEDEKRRIISESKNDCDMLDDLRLNSVPVNSDDLIAVGSDKSDVSNGSKGFSSLSSFQKNDFDDLDIFNSVPTNHPPLKHISYLPKYNPPLYCNPKFNSFSFDEKKNCMLLYHKQLITIYDSYQRKSLNYAPLSKPIQSDTNFNGSWLVNESNFNDNGFEDQYDLQDDNSNDIYISRSGRQTKRKLYSENRGEEKKSKLSQASSTGLKKKNVSDLNDDSKNQSPVVEGRKNRCEKLFGNLIHKEKKKEEQKKETDSFLNSLQVESDDDLFEDDTSTSRSGRYTRRMLHSEKEEEKKSNVFQSFKWQSKKKIDSDLNQDSKNRRPLSEKRKNKSEKLFDNLLETEKVHEEQKKEVQSFEVMSDDKESSEEVETVQVQEPFIKRRIVPPLRGVGRKNASNRSNAKTNKNPATYKNKNANEVLEPLQSSAGSASSDLSQDENYDVCPMCSLHFPKHKLEKHAYECIDLYEKKSSPVSSKTITCEKCDLVMPLTTDYELHVRKCLSISSKAT